MSNLLILLRSRLYDMLYNNAINKIMCTLQSKAHHTKDY